MMMTGVVNRAAQGLKSMFPLGSKEESINFVRFHNDPDPPTPPALTPTSARADATELRAIPNGSGEMGKEELTSDGYWVLKDGAGGEGAAAGGGGEKGELRDKKIMVDSVDSEDEKDRISAWQAGWNVTNAIQGMFIVTFPYAVLQGGYWAIFAMVFVAYVCCYTGKILVQCLYEVNIATGQLERVRHSYVQIAEEVWGPVVGGHVVNLAQLVELLMTCILYVLLCGDLLIGSFPNTPLDLASWIMISSAMLLPCAFLRSLRHVSWLSFWCTVAHMFINAIIIIYCLTRVSTWQWSAVQIKIDIWTFPISLGIVIFSYTSQIFLPTLEANMTDRSKFNQMLHWTHLAAAIFKAGFSYIGFVCWGFATKEVITNNLPNETMKIIVNMFLIAKALLSYPLPYFAAADLLEKSLFMGKPETVFPSCYEPGGTTLKTWGLALRLLLVMFTLGMAIFIPHFAILMGLIGSFTGNMLSLVWPCYFHLMIKGHELHWTQKFVNILIILFGIMCAILGVYYSSHALVRAFHGHEPRPFQGRT